MAVAKIAKEEEADGDTDQADNAAADAGQDSADAAEPPASDPTADHDSGQP